MVLTLGVVIEESSHASDIHDVVHSHDSSCHDILPDSSYREDCDKLKRADPWYYILLFVTDVVFVLCFFVMLLLFADWVLFVSPVRFFS